MECPKDIIDWIGNDTILLGYLYDADLMPEQITDINKVCAIRGFQIGWETHKDSLTIKKDIKGGF